MQDINGSYIIAEGSSAYGNTIMVALPPSIERIEYGSWGATKTRRAYLLQIPYSLWVIDIGKGNATTYLRTVIFIRQSIIKNDNPFLYIPCLPNVRQDHFCGMDMISCHSPQTLLFLISAAIKQTFWDKTFTNHAHGAPYSSYWEDTHKGLAAWEKDPLSMPWIPRNETLHHFCRNFGYKLITPVSIFDEELLSSLQVGSN